MNITDLGVDPSSVTPAHTPTHTGTPTNTCDPNKHTRTHIYTAQGDATSLDKKRLRNERSFNHSHLIMDENAAMEKNLKGHLSPQGCLKGKVRRTWSQAQSHQPEAPPINV